MPGVAPGPHIRHNRDCGDRRLDKTFQQWLSIWEIRSRKNTKLFQGLEGNSERDYILLLLCLPTLSSLVLLVSLVPTWRKVYQLKNGSTAAILCVLLFSIPSPIFLWVNTNDVILYSSYTYPILSRHLYYLFNLIWRRSTAGSRKCRLLRNLSIVMQLCRALTGSLPLLLYGKSNVIPAISSIVYV